MGEKSKLAWEKSFTNFSRIFISQRTRKNRSKIFPTPGTPSERGIKFLKTSKLSTFFRKDYSESLYHGVTSYGVAEFPDSTTSPLLFLVSVLHHVIFLEKNHYHVPYRPGVSLEGSVDRELKTSDNLGRLQPINSPSPHHRAD